MEEEEDESQLTQWDDNAAVRNGHHSSTRVFHEREDSTGRRKGALEGDGFNLFTHSNDLFQQGCSASEINESEGCSNEESDEESGGSSSTESPTNSMNMQQGKTMQQRRAENIKKHEAFANSIKMEMSAIFGDDAAQPSKKRKAKETNNTNKPGLNLDQSTNGQQNGPSILFPTKFNGMSSTQQIQQKTQTTTLAQELNAKYPHRSTQIHYLCARLQSIVSRTKMAWKMNENIRSYGESHYSEATYAGRVKMSVPPPILISGAGGSGKTSVVCDTIQSLRERTNRNGENRLSMYHTMASAYVDCASTESVSVASVLNNAYKQLYECFHPTNFKARVKKRRSKYRSTFSSSMESDSKRLKADPQINDTKYNSDHTPSNGTSKSSVLRFNDMNGYDSDIEGYDNCDEDIDEEEIVERQRKRRPGTKRKKQTLTSTARGSITGHTRHTRQQFGQSNNTKSASLRTESSALGNPIEGFNRNYHDSSSIAIFGRAVSSLLQGNASRKRAPRNGRCAFLVLDNADRILSWNKFHRNNPLAELLLLPRIMGVNLTLILISRSSIYQYSRVQAPPGTILDALQLNHIHFDAYSSVDQIKDIIHVPRIRDLIIGETNLTQHKHTCVAINGIRKKLELMCYTSLLSWFISNIKGSTQDLTEIIRLARLLWPEYMSPLYVSAGCIDSTIQSTMIGILCHLRQNDDGASVDCECSACRRLSVAECTRCNADVTMLKQRLFEKLDQNIRDTMRGFLATVVLMPGRVLRKDSSKPYAERLPYVTKFLLLAAFLCQNKKAESDRNLFTKKNTGKSKRSTKKADIGSSYAASSAELKQLTVRQPSFPLERLLSVFYSIMSSYGHSSLQVSEMGTDRLYQAISQLNATGLISRTGSSRNNNKKVAKEMTAAKFTCTLSREDARIIATSVGFPLDRYCRTIQ